MGRDLQVALGIGRLEITYVIQYPLDALRDLG
jgi:hypothetical protein